MLINRTLRNVTKMRRWTTNDGAHGSDCKIMLFSRERPLLSMMITGRCFGDGDNDRSSSSSSKKIVQRGVKKEEESSFSFLSSSSSIDTLLSHAGIDTSSNNVSDNNNNNNYEKSQPQNIPMAPPLYFASTFTRPADGNYRPNDSIYTRMDNPTRCLLEKTMDEIECYSSNHDKTTTTTITDLKEREDTGNHHHPQSSIMTTAFSSGMAAVSSILLAHSCPLTVLLPMDVYHGIPTVLQDVMSRFQIKIQRVDFTNMSELEIAINNIDTPQGIIWMETPSNPQCQVIDISQVCQVVKAATTMHAVAVNDEEKSTDIDIDTDMTTTMLTTVVDSTLSPPIITQPLRLGADLVMHSATKYLGGHSDVLLGIVTASPWTERGREMGPLLRQVQITSGNVASPMDSWLVLRGLRTLHLRVSRQSQTAMALAQYFDNHLQRRQQKGEQGEEDNGDDDVFYSMISKVHYPGLSNHPQHEVACRQMKDKLFGGVLSIELNTEAQAIALAGELEIVQRATSLGGTETLVEHRASIEPEGRVVSPPGLLRISAGLENVDDLIGDFHQAMKKVVEKEGSSID